MSKGPNALKVVFSPEAWTTVGRVSREEFETLHVELLSAAQVELDRAFEGWVRSGNLLCACELDRAERVLTVRSLSVVGVEGRSGR